MEVNAFQKEKLHLALLNIRTKQSNQMEIIFYPLSKGLEKGPFLMERDIWNFKETHKHQDQEAIELIVILDITKNQFGLLLLESDKFLDDFRILNNI